MNFIADLHVHSKHSRATARNLDLENLYVASKLKGITVIGTGDFTHPAWWQELKEKLQPAEEGLFALKPEIARACDARVPTTCRHPVRYLLTAEISNVYKKNSRTRKNHNLVYFPCMEAAERFIQHLDKIGNIRSDGRPILGLDARNLLEIVLETSESGCLVPAHIWTPWFSLLGSNSGFDSVQECFEDLTHHVFALETGLSSNPAMNWRVSALDRFTLVSNSDAHSPGKLGREATCFATEMSYPAIRRALEGVDADGFAGTIEFFPEEGKYHVDGHSACGFWCQPHQTRSLEQLCPVCGKPLIRGVLYRVEELADRPAGERPAGAKPYTSLIPLEEILGEIFRSGSGTQRVNTAYHQLIQRHGPEIDILRLLPREELERSGLILLGEAIERMRRGQVSFEPGYDGVYGRLRIFQDGEREALTGQGKLFSLTADPAAAEPKTAGTSNISHPRPDPPSMPRKPPQEDARYCTFNAAQQSILDHPYGPMLIEAGPGTGKTRTITARMAALMREHRVPAEKILALTFTRKAAREMKDRLAGDRPAGESLPLVTTFHGLCRGLLLQRQTGKTLSIIDDETRALIMADALRLSGTSTAGDGIVAESLSAIVQAKQLLLTPEDDLSGLFPNEPQRQHVGSIYAVYQNLLKLQGLFDFEDLIMQTVRLLENDEPWRILVQQRFAHIFVDEFQDINHGQYRLIQLLAPGSANVCVIGDANQSIYGFRGSDERFFCRFMHDYPVARKYALMRSYRSTETILQAAYQVLHASPLERGPRARAFSGIHGEPFVSILESGSAHAEAVAIGRTIEQLVGGTGFQAIDFSKVDLEHTREESGFGEFAVLYRTHEQGCLIAEVMEKAGIPCQQASRRAAVKAGPSKLMALMRLISEQGSYQDLNLVRDLVAPGVSRETLNLFKDWAYALKEPLAQACRAVLRVPVAAFSLSRQQRLAALIRWLQTVKQACEGQQVTQIIDRCVDQTKLKGKITAEDLQALLSSASEYGNDLSSFVADGGLQSDTDLYRPEIEKVALMTLHASKGLEFNFVFVAGCEEGLIPYHRCGMAAENPEEERRLFFVGLTRAKKQLFLSWARKRTIFGRTALQAPSSYLGHIEQNLKRDVITCGSNRPARQLTLF